MLKPVGHWPTVIGAFIGLMLIAIYITGSIKVDDKRTQLNRITWDRISELENRVFLLEKKMSP